MKYPIHTHDYTPEQRSQMRALIARSIVAGVAEQQGLTREIIFNTFSHKGGLHGLKFEDFDNFHAFTEAKKAFEAGQFFTPPALCEQIATLVGLDASQRVADLTCGMGTFFNACPAERNCVGLEYDYESARVAQYLFPDATIQHGDLQYQQLDAQIDFVFGNPPFNLRWNPVALGLDKDTISSQLLYILRAAQIHKPGGLMALIVPENFLTDGFQEQAAIQAVNEQYSHVCTQPLPRKVKGFGDIGTKVIWFQRRSEHLEHVPYHPVCRQAATTDAAQGYINAAKDAARTIRTKILLEARHRNSDDAARHERLVKLRYDISRHPATAKFLPDVDALIASLNAEKPADMSLEEWREVQPKPVKVEADIKAILRRQNPRLSRENRLLKHDYGVSYNGAYSAYTELIPEGRWPFPTETKEEQGQHKLFQRKDNAYQRQTSPYEKLSRRADIDVWLDAWRMTDHRDGTQIALNAIQKEDLGFFLQKDLAFAEWDAGSGKTLALLAWNQWQQKQHPALTYTIVTSSAMAIGTMWEPVLTSYQVPFTRIHSPKDLEQAQPGDYLLITFDLLAQHRTPRFYRRLKRWVRRIGAKRVTWLCDEAHNLANPESHRTQAVKASLANIPRKMFATATIMLNTPADLYPQFECLYNNSVNMMCWCASQYRYDRAKGGENLLRSEENPWQGQPYPARKGYEVFKACHSPAKASVFGIQVTNQNLYQLQELIDMTSSCVMTRTFEEIRGDSMLDIETHFVSMNEHEAALMLKIMEDLQSMLYHFQHTGDSRKEAGLRLIRQMNLLIKAASVPQHFREWTGGDLPGKFFEVFEILDRHSDEPILVGVTSIQALNAYHREILQRFPDRRVWCVSGEVSHARRKEIAAEFEQSGNGILVTTQQSLSESINIPAVNRCIVTALQWNDPKMVQFYCRLRRFNSTERTTVHIVCYEGSIEQNQLGLLLAKKRMTDAVKFRGAVSESSLFANFGVAEDFLDACVHRVREQMDDGRYRSRLAFGKWGQQEIE